MSLCKTTMLFNLKFPSNDVKLNLNFFPSQIISLWMKNIGNLKSLYLKCSLSFSLEFFEKVLLGLDSLYHIQMKSPKTVYLREQCQLISHRNSVYSFRREKYQKRHVLGIGIWQCTLLCIWSWNMSLQHFYPSIDWIQMRKCKFFFVQNALLKGSYSHANSNLDPLFISVNVISLLFNTISWKLLQIMRKWLFLTMISTIDVHM